MTVYLWVMFVLFVLSVCTNPCITGREERPIYPLRFIENVGFAIWTAVLLFGGKT